MEKLFHFDSAESVFLQRQLDFIKTQTYDVKYAELKARRLIPVSTEVDPGATRIFYRQYDQSGFAKVISNYADDLPRSDVGGKEFFNVVETLGSSYGYNKQEMRSALYGNLPLEQRRANSARRAVAQAENRLAFFGDVTTGIQGLFSNPNVTTVSLPADGVGASRAWSAKTPDQIIRDMNLVANSVVAGSLGVEIPDVLILPLAQYNYIASTPRSALSDTTILNFFLANNPYITQVEWVNELGKTASGFADDFMMAYRRSPEVLTLEIPMDFTQDEPQRKNLEYIINCEERFGGVIVYYPLAIAKATGL